MIAASKFVAAAAALTLSGALAAQKPLFSTDAFAGWESGSPGKIHVQGTTGTCPHIKTCNGIGTNTGPIVGGTAYDPRRQAVWISDGIKLQLHPLRTCQMICHIPATFVFAGGRVGGMTVQDQGAYLWVLETKPGIFAMKRYDVSTSPSPCGNLVNTCQGVLPLPNGIAGGIAFDELRNLIYMAVSVSTPTGTLYEIDVYAANNPCQLLCRWRFKRSCLRGVMTGLGYDAGKSELYATDGKAIQTIHVKDGNPCPIFRLGRCCSAYGAYRGLTRIPTWALKSSLKSCTSTPCPSCPTMHAGTGGGDPALGNGSFELRLDDAPGGNLAACFVKLGPAAPALPFWCGEFGAYPFALAFPLPILGAGCNGSAKQGLPIPPLGAICGQTLSVQWLIICPAATNGTGVSNLIEFTIASS